MFKVGDKVRVINRRCNMLLSSTENLRKRTGRVVQENTGYSDIRVYIIGLGTRWIGKCDLKKISEASNV